MFLIPFIYFILLYFFFKNWEDFKGQNYVLETSLCDTMEQVVLTCHNFFYRSLLFIAVLGIWNCLRISWKNNLRINSKIKLSVYYSFYCRLLSTQLIAFHLTRCNDWLRTTHRMLAGIAHKPLEVFLPSKWEGLCSYPGSMGLLQLSNHVVQNRHTGEQMTHWDIFKKDRKSVV